MLVLIRIVIMCSLAPTIVALVALAGWLMEKPGLVIEPMYWVVDTRGGPQSSGGPPFMVGYKCDRQIAV